MVLIRRTHPNLEKLDKRRFGEQPRVQEVLTPHFAQSGICGGDASRFINPENKRQFNGLFSRTIWLSRHQTGQTNLDFNELRNDGGGPTNSVQALKATKFSPQNHVNPIPYERATL